MRPTFLPPRALIGMVHVRALPGSPASRQPLDVIIRTAVAEARVLAGAGFDALIIENMHDRPYINGPHPPETVACMTRIAREVRGALPKTPLGVQVLSFGHAEALAVALAGDAQFIRVENFAYAHVADEGLLASAAAGPLLRQRRALGAEHILLACDVKKKHASHALTADLSIGEAARGAEFFGADALIVTGTRTGAPTDAGDVRAVRDAVRLPVWVGSGVKPGEVGALLEHADALIVGSSIKRSGVWSNPIDPARARAIVRARGRPARR